MFPTPDQIRLAAYYRWWCRGQGHGHDLDDWVAAEQDLLFALNYEVLACYRLDADGPQHVGDGGRRVCRFCEQAAPRTTFTEAVPALPGFLGNTSLLSDDECDPCRTLFEETIGGDFEAFSRPFLAGQAVGGMLRAPTARGPSVPIAAYKYLTKLALSVMPRGELEFFPDAMEWVCNPDHELDRDAFGGLGGLLYVAPGPFPAPWTALARRIEDDAPFPYMLYCVGTAHVAFEIPVPLCLRDEALDGQGLIIPRVAFPLELSRAILRGPASSSGSPPPT